jgi:hypothetical protein
MKSVVEIDADQGEYIADIDGWRSDSDVLSRKRLSFGKRQRVVVGWNSLERSELNK